MIVKFAKDPIWSSTEKVSINLIVRFEGVDEDFPFTATPWDTMDYGRDIYERALAGEFGVVAEWKAPSLEEMTAIKRYERDVLLQEMDALISNPLRWSSYTEEFKGLLGTYRQNLLDVPQQTYFPDTIIWPIKPWA